MKVYYVPAPGIAGSLVFRKNTMVEMRPRGVEHHAWMPVFVNGEVTPVPGSCDTGGGWTPTGGRTDVLLRH